MSRGNLAWMLTIPALLLAGLLVTYSAPAPEPDYQLVRTVVDVLAEVDKNYYKALSADEKKKFVEAMVSGGLHSLDDYSQYFNEENLTRFEHENTGEFGGVGITVAQGISDPHLVIASPMPGTPAYDAGLAPGDVILAIDGHSTENVPYEAARKYIVGKPGTPVVFSIRRGDTSAKPFEVTLTRALIEQHSVYGYKRRTDDPLQWKYLLDGTKVALIRLERFNEKAADEMKAALAAAKAEGMAGLILDVRDNGGGLLHQAHAISDLFLKDGIVVSTRNRDDQGRTLKASHDKLPWEDAEALPIVVLIDRNSASASEILAAALADNGRAILVGERSFGKGSVQKVFHLPPDEKRAVKLTSEIWLTPKGSNIHRTSTSLESDQWGVKPEPGYEVKLTLDDIKKLMKYRRSLDYVPGKPGVAPPAVPVVDKDPLPADYVDPFIAKAMEWLKGRMK